MVDYTAISTEFVADLKKASPMRFQHLERYGMGDLVTSATKAAESAVAKAADGTTAEGLKNIASEAFSKSFKQQSTVLLAKNGHPIAALRHMGGSVLNSAPETVRQLTGKTTNAAGEVVAKAPSRFTKAFAWLPTKIGNFATKNPKFTFVAAGLGAVYGGARLLEGRNEAKQQAEYEANMQQVAAMQQAAAAQAPANSYYGGVTREESAAMDAQMRNGGDQGGFVAAEQKRRAAAASIEQATKA